MRIRLTFFFCNFFILTQAQVDIKIFTENKSNGAIIYASNNEFCPVSLSLSLNLTNMFFTQEQDKILVIPGRTEKFKLGELSILTRGEKYKFSYQSHYNLGDVNISSYDTAYEYDLPFAKGMKFLLFQGYNGSFSHQYENALDFTMPEGTEVLSAREGIVIKVVDDNSESCPQQECIKYNNYITVYHADGTFANYLHIKYKGSKVKPGDNVKKGQVIALSGNTGFSSGPHLHFSCFVPGLEKSETIMTKFKINDGSKVAYLKEKETYSKNY